jgi:hypothetical protein
MTQINSNPWTSYQKPSIFHALTHLLDSSSKPAIRPSLPVGHIPNFEHPVMEPRVMWLGHAGCYLQLPTQGGSYGVLFDPIFSHRCVFSYRYGDVADDRCSPSRLFGPKRRMPSPCRVQDLLDVNLVVISHDHCTTFPHPDGSRADSR